MPELEGVLIPVPTPFRGDAVVPDQLHANLERWSRSGVTGYVVLGVTGEGAMLSDLERDTVLGAARESIAPGKVFVAGTGCHATLLAIRQTRRAAEMGADAALVLTPHAFARAFSPAGAQIRHFLAVAEASPIPIIVGNAPADTGINLDPDAVARIAEHPNVRGLEDASGNIPQVAEIIHLTPKSFQVLVSSAAALVPSLTIGGAGGVLSSSGMVSNCFSSMNSPRSVNLRARTSCPVALSPQQRTVLSPARWAQVWKSPTPRASAP